MTLTWISLGSPAHSGGETRTISLYHIHTGESLTVTYMVDGRYVPSAMTKINYLLRDWRKNQVITIDPKTIDLVWELHADLGSHAPIHIVCGYRTASTNNFLHSIGRNVARESQHILGKAIDIYFPDVPTIKMRNSALVRQVGGVGYYRSAGGPTGFLHVDSGRVRHWGPGISAFEMASIFRDYRRTIGARISHGDQVMVASSAQPPVDRPLDAALAKAGKQPPLEAAYQDGDQQLASLAAKAGAPVVKPVPRPKLVDVASADPAQPVETDVTAVTEADAVPKPRPKPIEVLMAAAVNMKIEPASAPPPTAVKDNQSPLADSSVGVVVAAESIAEAAPDESSTNKSGKGSLAASLADGNASGVPVIKAITASAASSDLFYWPQQVIFNGDKAMRRDGAPQTFSSQDVGLLPGGAQAAEVLGAGGLPRVISASLSGSVKADFQGVNRQGKGNLVISLFAPEKLGMLEQN
jgi:uncharacterized protein YcbK (DUF882 family)